MDIADWGCWAGPATATSSAATAAGYTVIVTGGSCITITDRVAMAASTGSIITVAIVAAAITATARTVC